MEDRKESRTRGNTLELSPSLSNIHKSVNKPKKSQHILEIVWKSGNGLERAVVTQLKEVYGIGHDSSRRGRRTSRAKTRKSTLTSQFLTPSPIGKQNGESDSHIPAMKLVGAMLLNSELEVEIPYFLKICCTYIRNHLCEEGLFRKGGACVRVKRFMAKLSEGAATGQDVLSDIENISVFEVCSAMKQLLQKMREPLIPDNLQQLLIDCCSLPAGQKKRNSLHLCLLLLPVPNLFVISYLMEFLNQVTQFVDSNKMDARNLAIVMTPNIMPIQEGVDGDVKVLLDRNVEVIKELIIIGGSLHMVSSELETGLSSALDSNLSCDEELEDGMTTGSAKRRKRSSSLNRMFDFLRKKKIMKSRDSGAARNEIVTPGIVMMNNTPVIMRGSRKTPRHNGFTDSAQIPNLVTAAERGNVQELSAGATPCRRLKLKLNIKPEQVLTPGLCFSQSKSRAASRHESIVSIHPLLTSPRSKLRRQGSSKIPVPVPQQPWMTSSVRKDGAVSASALTQIRMDDPTSKISPEVPSRPPVTLLNNLDLRKAQSGSESRGFEFDHSKLKPILAEIQAFTTNSSPRSTPKRSRSVNVPMSTWTVTYPKVREHGSEIGSPKRALNPTGNSENGMKYREFSFNPSGTWPSQRKILKAKRRSDEEDKVGKPALPVLSNMNPSLYFSLRTPRRSPRVALSSCTAQNPNNSSTKSTLRRGRPNTMRAGLYRPSPQNLHNNSNSEFSSVQNSENSGVMQLVRSYAESKNITLDRKGRITRPPTIRPGILKIDLNPMPRTTTTTQSQSQSQLSKIPQLEILPKLRREPNCTNLKPTNPEDLNLYNKKFPGRSISMTDGLARSKTQVIPLSGRNTLNLRQRNGYAEYCKLIQKPMSMQQGLNRRVSVQELVRKFEK